MVVDTTPEREVTSTVFPGTVVIAQPEGRETSRSLGGPGAAAVAHPEGREANSSLGVWGTSEEVVIAIPEGEETSIAVKFSSVQGVYLTGLLPLQTYS